MKDIFYFIECCSPKIQKSRDTLINHIPTQKLKEQSNPHKVLDEKSKKNKIIEQNNIKNNPFELIPQTSASQENISPRFIDGIINDDNNSYHSLSEHKRKFHSSIISFSNFQNNPIQIEKEDQGISGPKILLSGELFFGKEIIITTNGMVNGLREKNDGLAFFGLKNITDYRGTYYNDFVINYQIEEEEDKKKRKNDSATGRVFNLSFQKKTKNFTLYMIHDSIIIYYEINNFVYFNNDKDYYLLLGNIFITIVTKKNNNENNPKEIEVEIEGEDENNEIFKFNQNDTPITIGRTDCKISIPKPSISKIHGIIDFSKECNLFYYKDSGSTNGSILLVKEDDYLKIKGEMNFKLENIPFKIMELP